MNQRFVFSELPLPGLILIQRKRTGDARGYLERLFCTQEFSKTVWTGPISQINQTYTARTGTIRGMHFQYPPHAEKKLVSCLKGKVYDVAIDIRKGSPTFLKWHGEILSHESSKALLIPEGFAHGFQSLTDDVDMLYFHSNLYSPEYEGGIRSDDPAININWPCDITEISERDKTHTLINNLFKGVVL